MKEPIDGDCLILSEMEFQTEYRRQGEPDGAFPFVCGSEALRDAVPFDSQHRLRSRLSFHSFLSVNYQTDRLATEEEEEHVDRTFCVALFRENSPRSEWHISTRDHTVLPATDTFIHEWNQTPCL